MNKNLPKRISRKVIYESDWICLYADKVEMPDGRMIDKYHNLHFPYESSCVVIVNSKEEILLVQSKRYITSRLEWEVPAGRIENDETPEEAAKRECMEETGCTLKDLSFLFCQFPNNGISDMKVHIFGAYVENETMEFDENEVQTKKWVCKNDVLDMLRTNEIQCGVSTSALLYAINFWLPKI
jgi:NTP pyrophosphohydrolases containing a Zn-finger, probably nucleic-acid-binding